MGIHSWLLRIHFRHRETFLLFCRSSNMPHPRITTIYLFLLLNQVALCKSRDFIKGNLMEIISSIFCTPNRQVRKILMVSCEIFNVGKWFFSKMDFSICVLKLSVVLHFTYKNVQSCHEKIHKTSLAWENNKLN